MNKTRISLLLLAFFSSMLYQPNWVDENFWNKAGFYSSVPFTVPFLAFLIVYAAITTALVELGIRFVKKYA